MGNLVQIAAAAIAGFGTTFAFAPHNLWFLAVLGIALLAGLIQQAAAKRARFSGLLGFAWGLAFFLPHLEWANFATGVAPWFLLAASQGLFIGLVTWLCALFLQNHLFFITARWQAVVFGLLWTAGEELRSNVPFGGFPWGRIAFSQVDAPAGKLAWLGGAPLVTLVTVTAGAVLGITVQRVVRGIMAARSGRPEAAFLLPRIVVLGVSVPVVLLLLGSVIPLNTEAQNGTLRVGAVQGNVPGTGLDAFTRERLVLNNHVAETLRLAEKGEDLDLVVWPENATDIDPAVDDEAYRAIDDAALEVNAPILVGAVRAVGESERINISLLWQPGIGETESYIKQHPAPFGEYIPFRSIARMVSKEADRIQRDMIGGEDVGVVPLAFADGSEIPLGNVICFEVAYDGIVREAIAAGGEMLIIPTNNATFGFTNEAEQQLAMSRLRAIEHGRSTLQISTVGISAFIDPDGTITQRTGHYTAEHMISDMKLRTSHTPATLYGNWIAGALNLTAALLALAVFAMLGLNHLRWRLSARVPREESAAG